MGLPSVHASEEEVYEVASKLSLFRESIPIPNDGCIARFVILPTLTWRLGEVTHSVSEVRESVTEVWLGLTE